MTCGQSSLLLLCAGALLVPAGAQTGWSVVKTFRVGGQGGWDYVTVAPDTHRLYVTRSTHTMVIDSESGSVVGDIPGQKRSHGVALVPDVGRGFISDGGGSGAVVVFDLKTNAVLGTIAAQPDADGIIYDPGSRRVLVVSGDGGVLMTLQPDVDPAGGHIEAPIELGGKPEFLASDEAGKVYINLVDRNEVVAVDMHARKVVARWPVAPGGAPTGLAIDRQKHRLFVGCRNPQKLIVMSTGDGKVVASLPIGAGVDATKIADGEAFASCRDGTLTVAKESSGGSYAVAETVQTRPGARTMGVDPSTHRIYLPTAEFEPTPAGSNQRPAMKAGTFMILVVARQGG